MFIKRARKTTLLWIPGHYVVAGNEKTDVCAKQAAAITDGVPRPASFAAARAPIRRTLMEAPSSHCRTNDVYTKMF